jgi:phosphoglycerol transferase MdoB-like AlkP superfamily enzyme
MTCLKILKLLVIDCLYADHGPAPIPASQAPTRAPADRTPTEKRVHRGKERLRQFWTRLTGHRLGGTIILAALGILFFTITRLMLMTMGSNEAELRGLALTSILFSGLANDLVVSAYATLPLTFWLAMIPQRLFAHPGHRRAMVGIILLSLSAQLFLAMAEGVFWGEFATRFNFIAIDYLVYTTEVLTNIWESYPVLPLLAVVVTAAVILTWGMHRGGLLMPWQASATGWKARWSAAAFHLTAVVILAFTFDHQSAIPSHGNSCNAELAGNGILSLFAAYRQNELDYNRFYLEMPLPEVGRRLRHGLSEPNATFINDEPLDIRRSIVSPGPEKRWNVVVIVEESLSASFTGCLGGKALTPNLDRLATEGLLLTRCFATGTRTVRGLEAVTLSVPPTPGQSVIRRPDNRNLFSLGWLLRGRGYHNTFIYGGYGRFDNMNEFYSANGYDILDRSSPNATPQTFSTAWGVSDGDMFQWALHAADADHADGRPFHQLLMTTSNQRPYTFPEGTIDAPQKRRSSAVRYSDYALGAYLDDAANRDWFDSTLFVMVADHCHSTSGRRKLPLEKYHIPLLFYAPGRIAARSVDTVCSQIDVAPTILGLLGYSYESQFFGRDVLNLPTQEGRAPLGTFQTLGLLAAETGNLTLLEPVRRLSTERWSLAAPFSLLEAESKNAPDDCIALYPGASMRHRLGLNHPPPRQSPPKPCHRDGLCAEA